MKRICNLCNIEKELSEFYTYKKDDKIFYFFRCKECLREERIRKMQDPEFKKKNQKYANRFKENHPDYFKKYMENNKDKYKETINRCAKLYYEKNKEYVKNYSKEYRRKLKSEQKRNYRLKAKYDITLEEFNELKVKQNNKCSICKTELDQTDRKTKSNLDHNHTTGKVRGILCHKCNTGIGLLNEDIEILASAIEYLNMYLI